jgi:hypothetical protein
MTKGFILYQDYREHFDNMQNDAEKVELLNAIFDYHKDGETKKLSPVVKATFAFIRKELERQKEKYMEVCERNKKNSKNAGRPKNQNNPKESNEIQKNPVDTLEIHSNPENPITNNKEQIINIKEQKEENKEKEKEEKKESVGNELPQLPEKKENKDFEIPTIEKIKGYIQQKGLKVDANMFFCFYESKGWLVGKVKMKCWKSALSGWNTRELQKSQVTQNRNFMTKQEKAREAMINSTLETLEPKKEERHLTQEEFLIQYYAKGKKLELPEPKL